MKIKRISFFLNELIPVLASNIYTFLHNTFADNKRLQNERYRTIGKSSES